MANVTGTTQVPQPSFGATGFQSPSAPAILAGVQSDIAAAFGIALNFALTTPQGQLASSWAAIVANVYAIFVYYTQQIDPAYATGRMQDAIARIYFLQRNPAEPTTLQVQCVGAQITIPVGALIADENDNLYAATDPIAIPASGSIIGEFACTVPGPTAVPGANQVSIYQQVQGWDSATVTGGTQGVNTESRQAFEQRREDSVEGNSLGPIGAIIGAVAQVPGVTDYWGYSNNTANAVTISSVSIPANAIYISVAGGAESAVATAILSKKGPGAPMAGNTTVTAYDSNPLYASPIPYQITFEIPAPLQLLFSVTLVNSAQVPSNAAALVQQAIVNAATQGIIANNPQFISGVRARIGNIVYATTYIQAVNALGSWAQVAALEIGSANTPGAVVVGTISGTTLSVSSVVSGALAVGQTLTGSMGGIINATQIVAFNGGSGGTGTYTVNNLQTVGGASFTGTGTGAFLTASGVSGTIGVGNLITGSGVPGGTTIIGQLSGTVGGVGVYQTSANTTASGTITTRETITAASANQSLVQIAASQVPQTLAPNIIVGVT
jgi:hypothetical protein